MEFVLENEAARKGVLMSKTRVLVVDDDPNIRRFIQAGLKNEGYEPHLAADGVEGISIMEEVLPELLILDISMPNMDGFEVCRRIREWSTVPIIMLSARQSAKDKVDSFRLGADDYLEKPFNIEELFARIKAVLRRSQSRNVEPTTADYEDGYLHVNFAARRVTVDGSEVELTPTEYDLLRELMMNSGKVMTPRMLLQKIWGPEYGEESDYVRVYVTRLRRKLSSSSKKPNYIKNIPRVGYRFDPPT